jgi:STE24 endopeptidase
MRPRDDEEVRQLVQRYAGGEGAHARQMFEGSLRAALDLPEMRALVQRLGFDPDSVQPTSDRHWTWSTRAVGDGGGEVERSAEPSPSEASEPYSGRKEGADARPGPARKGMGDAELAEAKEYGRTGLLCDLADKGLDIAFLAVAAFLLARPLDAWLAAWPGLGPLWSRLGVMFLVITVAHIAVSFPLSYYAGHVLEHRYGLSRQSFGRWLWRYTKRNLLGVGFGLGLIQGLYWIIWLTDQYWWLLAAGGFFAVSVLLGQLAPVLILPLFYRIRRLDDPQLAQRLTALTEGTDVTIEGVYRMELSRETVKANAMLAGLGRTRRVILGDTLLDGFSPEEIEVIFAHEIGHHVHQHIRKMILAGLVYSAISFYLCDRILAAWVEYWDGALQYGTLPVYTLPLLMLAITVLSMLLEPLQNTISRYFERQSDWYALTRTGRVDAYRSAFRKLAQLNKADPDPHPLEVVLFHSHPTISQRLAMADRASCPVKP